MAALLIGIAVISANEITRRAAVSLLVALTDGRASVAKVRLGLQAIRVQQVHVWSSDCREPTLSIREIVAELSLIRGLTRGVWIAKVSVDRPQLHLHLDEAGKLVTRIPQATSDRQQTFPMNKLPIAQLAVKHARLVVHQPGRTAMDIDQMNLQANANGRWVGVDARIPRFLGGTVQLHSDINIGQWESCSNLQTTQLHASSAELVQWPLVPNVIHAQPWNASTSLVVDQVGSLTDLRRLCLSLQVQDVDVSLRERPGIIKARSNIRLAQGNLSGETIGQVLGGTLAAKYDARLLEAIGGSLQLDCRGWSTRALPDDLLPPDVQADLDTSARLTATVADGLLRLQGDGISKVADTELYGIVVAPATAQFEVNGALDLDTNSQRSSGAFLASIESEGVSLDQLADVDWQRVVAAATNPVAAEAKPDSMSWLTNTVRPTGQLRGAARMRIPLASFDDPRTYAADATVDVTGVEVQGIVVTQGRGALRLADEQLAADFRNLEFLDTRNGQPSSLSAIASGSLRPDQPLHATLRLNRLSAATLGRLAGIEDRSLDGELLARVQLHCNAEQAAHPEAWRGEAVFQTNAIRMDGQPLAHAEARCRIGEGVVSLQQLHGKLLGGELDAQGACQLVHPFALEGNGSWSDVSVQRLAALADPSRPTLARGVARVAFDIGGNVAERSWQCRGQMMGRKLYWGNRPVHDTDLAFQADPLAIVITSPEKGFLGGGLELTATGLLGGVPSGTGHAVGAIAGPMLSGRWVDISLPVLARVAGLQERVEGVVSGEFTAHSLQDLQTVEVVATMESAGIAVGKARLQQIQGDVQLQEGHVQTHWQANGFGGDVDLKADADVMELVQQSHGEPQALQSLPVNASAVVSNVRLQALWPVIGQQQQLRPLRGTVTGTFRRGDAERQQHCVATGDLKLRDLRWDNVLWSNQLHADVTLNDRNLEARRVVGSFADGRIHGRGSVSLDAAMRGSFEFSASRVSLQKVLAPVDRRGELATGLVSMRTHGRLGPRCSGRTMITMDRGTAGPIALARLRVPVDWTLDPAAKIVQWRTTNAGLELGGGRVVTNAHGRWNGRLDMTLATTARRVDTGRLLRGNTRAGGGYLDGDFRLSAQRATGVNDFTGKFDATLSDADSLQIPVVSDLTKFLTTLPATTSYDESRIQGRLGNGMVHLDRVTLAAANAQVLAEGTATLGGRLNLQVMAKTGETGPADKLLELADSPLLMAAPTPIALVAKANRALQDRVVHLRIGGTAARPVIRLEPGRQIGQEAIKFFMNQAVALRDKSHDFSLR